MSNTTQLVDYINRNIFPKVNVNDLDENRELIYYLNDCSTINDSRNVIYYCVQGIADRTNADQEMSKSIISAQQAITDMSSNLGSIQDATKMLMGVSSTQDKIYMVGSKTYLGDSSTFCNSKCYEYNNKVFSNERQVLTSEDTSVGLTFLANDGLSGATTYPIAVTGTAKGTYYKAYSDPSVFINGGVLYSGGKAVSSSTAISYSSTETTQAITGASIGNNGVITYTMSEIKKNGGFQGVQGTMGTQGYQGTMGYQGATGTGISLKASQSLCTNLGDAYIDTTLGGVTQIHVLIGLNPKEFQTNAIAAVQGIQGYKGASGTNGTNGSQGVQGMRGIQGVSGVTPEFEYDDTTGTLSVTTGTTTQNLGTVKGSSGSSAYITVKYAKVASPSSVSDLSSTPGTDYPYIAVCASSNATAYQTIGNYSISKYVGSDGTNGTSWMAADASFRVNGNKIQFSSDGGTTWTDFNGTISVTPDLSDYVRSSTNSSISGKKEFIQGVTCSSTGVSISAAGQINASNGFYETSDERLKHFDGDVSINFQNLKQIPKKYFVWKDDKSMKLNIGTSAQKVYEYFPELVYTDESDHMSVSYEKLSIIALAAIDKLKDEVDSLHNEITKLKNN